MSWKMLVNLILIAIMILLNPLLCLTESNHQCHLSSCGNIENITYPFRLKGDPENCGDPNYELSCERNQTILNLYNGKYIVESINYNNSTIRVTDSGLNKENCSSTPLYTLTNENFTTEEPYRLLDNNNLETIAFINCAASINSPLYIDTSSCIKGLINSSNYAVFGELKLSELEDSCSILVMVMMMTSNLNKGDNKFSYVNIHQQLVYGLELSWHEIFCKECQGRGYCKLNNNNEVIGCSRTRPCRDDYTSSFKCALRAVTDTIDDLVEGPNKLGAIIGLILLIRIIGGVLFIPMYMIYKWRRRHLSAYDSVEEFLKTHNNLMPIRYSYSDIKKMTKGFKDKLGEGGYGSVYKGQLRNGDLVAIKMLGGKSRANGQEFINEVATIGTIHHVNVVRLIGFCVEKTKRALVYEFMPNGSLDKHIFSRERMNNPLSCEKMFDIALGVARGIEYLHRGCDMRILHFDIKPHNILLDVNFSPKVSDFGLAKLYPIDNSIVSLTAARGTMGYMAPELFYKNIGGVSYKADVYSFGMLLMEMASRRRNMNEGEDHKSQVYFPSWVYDQFSEGKEIEMGNGTEEEEKILKKMIIVALWCIQMKPSDRPSMNKVVELLEGDVESLEMPPKPFQTPKGMPVQGIGQFRNLPWLLPGDSTNSLTIVVNRR
ncbi:hypothetical protein P8452_06598 [Trifolium repens]|nr:hypothetical protein P8452_06598 [Trifolium repens]